MLWSCIELLVKRLMGIEGQEGKGGWGRWGQGEQGRMGEMGEKRRIRCIDQGEGFSKPPSLRELPCTQISKLVVKDCLIPPNPP